MYEIDKSRDWEWITEQAEIGSAELDRREAAITSLVSMVVGMLSQNTTEAKELHYKLRHNQLSAVMNFPGGNWEIRVPKHWDRAYSPRVVVICWMQCNWNAVTQLVAYQSDQGTISMNNITRVYQARHYLTALVAACSPSIMNQFRPFFEAAGTGQTIADFT